MTDNKVINEQTPTTDSESPIHSDADSKVIFKVSSSSSVNTSVSTQFHNEHSSSTDLHKNDYRTEVLTESILIDSNQSYDKDYSPERDLEDLLSIVEPCQDASKASSEVDSGAASDSADTSCAQINLTSLSESELITNEDVSSKVSY